MDQNQESKDINSIELDLDKIYEECEQKGVSKEVISTFISFQRRIRDAKNPTGA